MPHTSLGSNLGSNSDVSGETLSAELLSLLRYPFRALVEGFNWKTAAISAMLRGVMFFFTNLRAGTSHHLAPAPTLVESMLCDQSPSECAVGMITQRIRNARPAWLTGLVVWFALPVSLLTVQFFVHRAFGTPHLKASMIASFCFAAFGTGFNCGSAMRRGALLTTAPVVGDSGGPAPGTRPFLPTCAPCLCSSGTFSPPARGRCFALGGAGGGLQRLGDVRAQQFLRAEGRLLGNTVCELLVAQVPVRLRLALTLSSRPSFRIARQLRAYRRT